MTFKSISARTQRFSEEDIYWRLGMVTREGVLIKGIDPLQGSWMGKFLSMVAVDGCLCILTTQMELHVFSIENNLKREIPLNLRKSMDSRSEYAKGDVMVAIAARKMVVMYDKRMEVLVQCWPKDGRVVFL